MSSRTAPELVSPSSWSARRAMRKIAASLQRTLVPGLQNSQYAYREALADLVTARSDWLDMGCGHQLLPEWMPGWEREEAELIERAALVAGIDLDQGAIVRHKHIQMRVVGDLHRLPFQDGCFSLVTANVVVEHVAEPSLLLAEVFRVLRPGGQFLFHTPNFLSYGTLAAAALPQTWKNKLALLLQGRREEDVYPTFYRINTQTAIKRLALKAGFTMSKLRILESSAQTSVLGPLAVFELLLIKMLRLPIFENYRTNVIAVLSKRS